MINHIKRLGSQGFTLIELVVSISIGAIVLASIIQMVLYGMRVYNYQVLENNQYNVLDYIETIVSDQLRYADQIYITDEALYVGTDELFLLQSQGDLIQVESDKGIHSICDTSLYGVHSVDLTFDVKGNVSSSKLDNIYVTVILDKGESWELEYEFNVKILNVQGNEDGFIQVIESSSKNKIIYNIK